MRNPLQDSVYTYQQVSNTSKAKLCDVIKQNESGLANIDFKIQSIKTFNFLCILLF